MGHFYRSIQSPGTNPNEGNECSWNYEVMQTHLYFCNELGYGFEFRPVTRSHSSNDWLRFKKDLICSKICSTNFASMSSMYLHGREIFRTFFLFSVWGKYWCPTSETILMFTFSKQFFNETVLQPFIASWMTRIWLTAATLTCPYNTLRTSNSFARIDTGVVIDSMPHMSHTCKTSLLCVPLAVRVQAGCSAFQFYTLTKLLIRLHFKYKTDLLP